MNYSKKHLISLGSVVALSLSFSSIASAMEESNIDVEIINSQGYRPVIIPTPINPTDLELSNSFSGNNVLRPSSVPSTPNIQGTQGLTPSPIPSTPSIIVCTPNQQHLEEETFPNLEFKISYVVSVNKLSVYTEPSTLLDDASFNLKKGTTLSIQDKEIDDDASSNDDVSDLFCRSGISWRKVLILDGDHEGTMGYVNISECDTVIKYNCINR